MPWYGAAVIYAIECAFFLVLIYMVSRIGGCWK